jgi:Ni,Fe-hydrogenase I cytochrome b subunit
MELDVENPLHIPVANLVVIEVDGQPMVEPKIRTVYETCIRIWDYIQITAMLLMLFGGFIAFMLWLTNPLMFGSAGDD